MKITVDQKANTAYIYFAEQIANGEIVKTIPAESPAGAGYLYLDFDKYGKLLGIEVIGASVLLKEELLKATEK